MVSFGTAVSFDITMGLHLMVKDYQSSLMEQIIADCPEKRDEERESSSGKS
jgi:hypothetical protein